MFEDLNTKVHNVRELVAWLDEHRRTGEAAPTKDGWDPEATGIMQAPQLDAMLAHEQAQAVSPEDQAASVSGSLEAFHVVELLQALSSGDRTGVLELSDGKHYARVHLDHGRITAASWDDDADIEPIDALKRAAALVKGDFRFGPQDDDGPPPYHIITLSTVQVLIEISSVAWELTGGQDDDDASLDFNLDAFDDPAASAPRAPMPVDLPPVVPFGARPLRLADPLLPRLRELGPDELDVLQALLRYRTLDEAHAALGGDKDAARQVVRSLLARGYLAG